MAEKLRHPIKLPEMTAEQAIQGTIEMWTDMMIQLGENPSRDMRLIFKDQWVINHGYLPCSSWLPGHLMGDCFLCEYALRKSQKSDDYNESRCLHCPIAWPVLDNGRCSCQLNKIDYRFTPIPEILEYLKNKENWKWTNSK